MSAMACFMADRGHSIAGSDRDFDGNPRHPVYKLLRSKGITLAPQDGSGLDKSFDFAVFSTAVESDRPEVIRARSLDIPVKTRPEYLAEIVLSFETIAVAGTSGKSTSAGMLAFLMEKLGLGPNFIGGGRVKQFKKGTNPGNSITGSSSLLVVEACESDGTIVNYKPRDSVILNLDLDHHSIDETAGMFRTLIKNTSGTVVLNADDDNLMKMNISNAVTFSIDNPSHYKAIDVVYGRFGSEFGLKITLPSIPSPQGRGAKKTSPPGEKFPPIIPSPLGGEGEGEGYSHENDNAATLRFRLSVPGKYNLYNALSCIAMLSELGIPLKDIACALYDFEGIERRFDIHLDDGERLVLDDYAHNPHKIASLMETVRNIRERVCYIFQPHGFAPTKMMKAEYIDAFAKGLRDSDRLVLLPIFYAGGTVSRDISSHDLAEGIKAGGKTAEAAERADILSRAGEWDTYVVFGARDETLSDFAREIARLLLQRKTDS